MKFYTNITRWGNQLLLREYVDGQRLNRRIKYSPTMYSIVTKPTEYRTLEGKFVILSNTTQCKNVMSGLITIKINQS